MGALFCTKDKVAMDWHHKSFLREEIQEQDLFWQSYGTVFWDMEGALADVWPKGAAVNSRGL